MTDPDRGAPGSGAARRVAAVVRPAVRALSAYHVAPAGGVVKLDAMENPYGLPEALREEWLQALRGAELNRYPDASATALKDRLRAAFALPPEASILLGNGSDEIIQIIQTAVDGPVLAPEPSFVMYGMVARFFGTEFIGVPLAEDFGLDVDAMEAAVNRHQPAVVFIAYPNNPTGNLFDAAAIRRLIDAAPGLVVIDEAYHAFAKRSLMDWVATCPNVLVMRTLSKLGLAGVRLGFAVADPDWMEQFEKVRLPYNVGVLTQKSVEFALAHLDVFLEQAERITGERGRVHDALQEAGYECFPSQANFILFRCRENRAERVYRTLLDRGVLVKNLSAAHPALVECLRVTIGTPQENDRFLGALPAESV